MTRIGQLGPGPLLLLGHQVCKNLANPIPVFPAANLTTRHLFFNNPYLSLSLNFDL